MLELLSVTGGLDLGWSFETAIGAASDSAAGLDFALPLAFGLPLSSSSTTVNSTGARVGSGSDCFAALQCRSCWYLICFAVTSFPQSGQVARSTGCLPLATSAAGCGVSLAAGCGETKNRIRNKVRDRVWCWRCCAALSGPGCFNNWMLCLMQIGGNLMIVRRRIGRVGGFILNRNEFDAAVSSRHVLCMYIYFVAEKYVLYMFLIWFLWCMGTLGSENPKYSQSLLVPQ